jgi:hypothetical protein
MAFKIDVILSKMALLAGNNCALCDPGFCLGYRLSFIVPFRALHVLGTFEARIYRLENAGQSA